MVNVCSHLSEELKNLFFATAGDSVYRLLYSFEGASKMRTDRAALARLEESKKFKPFRNFLMTPLWCSAGDAPIDLT